MVTAYERTLRIRTVMYVCVHVDLLSAYCGTLNHSIPDVVTAYERIYPRVPSVGGPHHWSESGSDYVSTRDSFTSLEDDE